MTYPTRRTLMTTAALAGLASQFVIPSPVRAQTAVPKRGGTLTSLLTPEPPVLIPGVNNQGPTLIVVSKIYQSLLEFSEKLEPKPLLAKSWELSDDRKTYTFHLQDNVKFHDGTPMTADDVIFSIMKFHFELAPRARGVFSKIKSATAPDPHTVVLTLDAPFDPFLLMFDVTTVAIMPKHIYDGTDYRNNPANQKPIGTGAFQFSEWQRGNFIALKRFDQYWKPGQPYLDGITYRIVPDSQSRALALQTGQVMMSAANDIEPFDVPRFQTQPNLTVETAGWEYFSPLMWIELNHRVKPLDDARVRQAMSMALDRDFILKRLWFNVGKLATGPVASTTKYYDPSLKPLPHDIKKAIALLDEAGVKPDANGVRFKIRHLTLPYGEIWARLAEYFRASMKQIGIEVTLESTDTGGWARRLSDWDYDTSVNFLYQYGDPTLGVERTYVSTNIQKVVFTNTGGYVNPEVDKLFTDGRNGADPADRQKAFFAVQKLLVEQIPQIWLLEMAFPTIHDTKVKNVITLGTGIHAPFDDVTIS
ncbi:ABC transporter substrate-binding protein [Acidisphaera sp. L21]|uniref:ABC transporter substrate-binding protein n=1 Tax=Acidisphaera sp. L21 TaxID=1641851 RepID=UPI00131E6085|nr:ABC transporter substrate-binding protein [Acidisphaera sp. L21]